MSDGMRKLYQRAQSDPAFFGQLISNPADATKDFDLTESERASLAGNTPERLRAISVGAEFAAGCGSSGTCTSTCTATCTVTFTSIVDEVSRPIDRRS